MTFFIAEVGVNHENSLDYAKLMIRQASQAGFNAVKFQAYKAKKLAANDSPAYWNLDNEPTKSQRALFSKYDKFGKDEFEELANYCSELNIEFMSTAFDLDSLQYLDPLVERHKVASADITNVQFIKAVASRGKPLILSTGASTFLEIEQALGIINKFLKKSEVTLCHCVLNYPTLPENAFLLRIKELQTRFEGYKIGYSDHVVDGNSHLHLLVSQALGATLFEKHFTYDETLPGNDHYHAFAFHKSIDWLKDAKELNKYLGPYREEDFIRAQQLSIRNARRGLYAARDLSKGTTLKASDLICLRPMAGICASKIDEIIGKKLVIDVAAGKAIYEKSF